MAKKLALTPNRTFQVPGGPVAKDLAKVNVAVLADFRRGESEDLERIRERD